MPRPNPKKEPFVPKYGGHEPKLIYMRYNLHKKKVKVKPILMTSEELSIRSAKSRGSRSSRSSNRSWADTLSAATTGTYRSFRSFKSIALGYDPDESTTESSKELSDLLPEKELESYKYYDHFTNEYQYVINGLTEQQFYEDVKNIVSCMNKTRNNIFKRDLKVLDSVIYITAGFRSIFNDLYRVLIIHIIMHRSHTDDFKRTIENLRQHLFKFYEISLEKTGKIKKRKKDKRPKVNYELLLSSTIFCVLLSYAICGLLGHIHYDAITYFYDTFETYMEEDYFSKLEKSFDKSYSLDTSDERKHA